MELCIDYLYQMGFTININISSKQTKFNGSCKSSNQYYTDNIGNVIIQQKRKYYEYRKKMIIDRETSSYIESVHEIIGNEEMLKQLYVHSCDQIDSLINQIFIIGVNREQIMNMTQIFGQNEIKILKQTF